MDTAINMADYDTDFDDYMEIMTSFEAAWSRYKDQCVDEWEYQDCCWPSPDDLWNQYYSHI